MADLECLHPSFEECSRSDAGDDSKSDTESLEGLENKRKKNE